MLIATFFGDSIKLIEEEDALARPDVVE